MTLRNRLYVILAALRRQYLRKRWGMTIGKGARISRHAHLDKTNPRGIHIGDYTIVTPGARILTHDYVGAYHDDTVIGSCCFIGANAIILNAVRIGDHCIVAAGSVVTSDVPDRSLVAGNPARVIRSGINTGHYGMTAPWVPGRLPEDNLEQNSHGLDAPKSLDERQTTEHPE